jgi:hypothetical protein
LVEITDVRNALNNIEEGLVTDEAILSSIEDAESELEYLSNTNVPTQLVELAIKQKAVYKSYLAYVLKMERGIDTAPTPQMRSALDMLLEEFNGTLKKIEREYAPPTTGVVPVTTTDSLGDQV